MSEDLALRAAVRLFHDTWSRALGAVAVGAGDGQIIVYLKSQRALRTARRVAPKLWSEHAFPVVLKVSGVPIAKGASR